jgi:hypothetical protein
MVCYAPGMAKDDLYFVVGTILGLLGLLGVPWQNVFGKITMPSSRSRIILMLVCLLGSLAMSSVGWYKSVRARDSLEFETGPVKDVADLAPLNDRQKLIIHHLKAMESDWDGYSKWIYVRNVTLANQTVLLDGRFFSNCTFKNVTLVYQGTAPFAFDPNSPSTYLAGTYNVGSDIPMLKTVLAFMVGVRGGQICGRYVDPILP